MDLGGVLARMQLYPACIVLESKLLKFVLWHNFGGCSWCNIARCKVTTILQPPKGVLQFMLTDPTYGAYVMDLSGNILSPAEIRNNLINDVPMNVNDEADYNGDKKMAKTSLNEFLAGNLYHLSSNTISRDSNEETGINYRGSWIVLTPVDEDRYFYSAKVTTDDSVFWQAPE